MALVLHIAMDQGKQFTSWGLPMEEEVPITEEAMQQGRQLASRDSVPMEAEAPTPATAI